MRPMLGGGFVPRLVVKFRGDAPGDATPPATRVAQLAADTGIPLVHVRTMAVGVQVLTSLLIRSAQDAEALVARIATHPDVVYAERSRQVRAARIPNDPRYADQFYLQPGATTIDAQTAWDMTTGSPAVVVAVLDSGSTNHADLAGRLLPGYDFVANFNLSNDGNAKDAVGNYRDADASDPGDWVTAADLSGPLASSECTVRDSSWHGTSVIGALAARSDNGDYVTGVDWNARIVPVRVLGKCYGDDIDVADGIVWASGAAVPAAPANPTPAHVINLSLGDPGPCPQFLQDSIDTAFAGGVTRAIVAAAGNQGSAASHFPSACIGVLAIGASTFGGNRAGYSNYGERVDLMAPGGNGVSGSAYNFLALDNTGATVPAADSASFRNGTSFATPLVSGVVSLMLSVAPGLTPAQVREILKASAKPFPAGSTCNTAICGAGILDAPGAVRRALATTGAAVAVTLVEYYHAAFDHYFITWMPAGDRVARRGHDDQGLDAHGQDDRRIDERRRGHGRRLPHLHSAGPGRRPLLRTRRGRVRRHDGEEPDVRPRVAGLLPPVSADGGQLRSGNRARLPRLLEPRGRESPLHDRSRRARRDGRAGVAGGG